VRKSIPEQVLEQGLRTAGRVAGAVMSDPRGQEAVARAVGAAQRGLALFGAVQERALHLAGLAARSDYGEVRKQVARLKRKARELSARIGEQAGPGSRGRSR
jgi:phage shock protein A